ncbi:ATP-binding cassette domain-containing protein [Paenibacillus graminis]|uniref:ATP-binding cassette domain-containing protein n=1 Tax=Paenibacillus graminis TaxID=189425 RepID=UPI002DBC5157|nr:ATP-binding cassette domain-containing protein [Paenibacillus graminis]MEC0168824.1 ATP-binding cassette domain-containing protein [Paenibacillus graminis]
MNITIRNLKMIYPTGKTALQDISLEMNSPNLIGLVGPNGAGKSTLMNLLVAGLLPTSGQIQLDGAPLEKNTKKLKSTLGYLPQSFGLYDELTVWQFLEYIAALKGIKDSQETIKKVILETNLTDQKKARIRTLSGGQRQRVGIAQAFLGEPELLIFDEPTVGLDPEERIHFRNLFSKSSQNKIVLLSTHIIEDVQSICNRLIVFDHGSMLFDGKPEQLIMLARGHVGILQNQSEQKTTQNYQVTARVNTADGVNCRIVAEKLPAASQKVEPSLEDAYTYLIAKEGRKL